MYTVLTEDKNGIKTNNIISIFGIFTPEDKLAGLLPLLNETVTIQTPNGLVNGQAIYVDNAPDGTTTVKNVQYAVGANSGEFAGAKIITIHFDNINYKREVVVTF